MTDVRRRVLDSGSVPQVIARNDLESRRFGVSFGRLDPAAAPSTELATTLVTADGEGIDVLSTRVDATDLDQVRTLEDLGFRIMDTLVYYRHSLTAALAGAASGETPAPFEIGGADAKACSRIARRAFRNYMGHYHADPRLADDAADEAYADWIVRLLLDPAPDQIALGTAANGELVGFLVGQAREDGTSEIVLNAVSPDGQRGGHYTALLHGYLDLAAQRGDREVVISTQLQNYPVQRIWARAGFALFKSFHTLHRWASAQP